MNSEDQLRRELHQVLDAVGGRTPDLMPGIAGRLGRSSRKRRLAIVAQLAGAIGAAFVIGAVILSIHWSRVAPPVVTTSPTVPVLTGPGAAIAWVTSDLASQVVTGVDQAGRVVGRINAPVDLRSPDGAHLYAQVGSEVEVFSALDGHQEATIHLRSVTNAGLELLSADGRYLAVAAGSQTILELVDLTAGRSVASIRLGALGYPAPVIVGPHAGHIYLVGDTVVRIGFDGSSLRVEQQGTSHQLACNGLVVGGANSAGGLPFHVLADGRTLVAFCPSDGRVTWFDLSQMKVIHELTHGQANPFWVSPVFSPDGNTLYLHEGGTGALAAVDLIKQTVSRSTKVAMANRDPLAWVGSLLVTPAYAGGIPRTAAVSPDGNWLYAVGIFGAPGGVSVVHLPDLTVRGRWLSTQTFDTVWVSADGQTIYGLTQSTSVLRLLRTDGSLIAAVNLPAAADNFVVPSLQ